MSDQTCPNAGRHTPAPEGYMGWHSWAAAMYGQGSRQSRCRGCGLWAIWTGMKPPILPREHETTCIRIERKATA